MTLVGKHNLAGLVWIILLGNIYLVIDSQVKPKVAIATSNAAEVMIPRSRDSHFYLSGQINGQALTFMVDTGASTVAINQGVAQRLELSAGRPVTIGTAGGKTQGFEVAGVTLSIGGITLNNVRIVVLTNMPGEALLGQNVLRHLEVIQSATPYEAHAEFVRFSQPAPASFTANYCTFCGTSYS